MNEAEAAYPQTEDVSREAEQGPARASWSSAPRSATSSRRPAKSRSTRTSRRRMSSAGSLMSSIGGGRCTASCGRSSPTASGCPCGCSPGPTAAGWTGGPPAAETVRHVLRHPMYAGAYRYRVPADGGAIGRSPGARGAAGAAGLAPELPGVPEGSLPGVHHLRAIRGEPGAAGGQSLPGRVARRCRPRRRRPAGRGGPGAGGAGGGCTCGTGGPIGGRPTSAVPLRSDYGLPLCPGGHGGRGRGLVGRAGPGGAPAGGPGGEPRRVGGGGRAAAAGRPAALGAADRAGAVTRRTGLPASIQACEPENRLVARTVERQLGRRRRLGGPTAGRADFDRFVRSQPRLVGAPARADPPAGRGGAGAVAGPDDDAGGPEAGRPAAGGPGGADRRPGR